MRVFGYALSQLHISPAWDRYKAWADYVGDLGVVYMPLGYSAIGHLLNYWMGIEKMMFAAYDWAHTMHGVVEQINAALLRNLDVLPESPAEVIFMGDNFSSDIQPPHFFAEWSQEFYSEAIRRAHAAGKYVAVHIDGRLGGLLKAFAEIDLDCADAVTPAPMGDLTPSECRDEAGPDMILSGGVPPNLWLPDVSDEEFKQSMVAWLDTAKRSPRLIANAGDQVPPGAVEHRIELSRDLVDKCGKYLAVAKSSVSNKSWRLPSSVA